MLEILSDEERLRMWDRFLSMLILDELEPNHSPVAVERVIVASIDLPTTGSVQA